VNRRFLSRLGLVALGCGVISALGASAQSEATKPAEEGGGADLAFQKVQLWSFKGSQLSATGNSEEVFYDRSAGQGHGRQVESTIFPRHPGEQTSYLKAGAAAGQVAQQRIDASDHVSLSREDGTARTESASYRGEEHLIRGNQPVDFVTDRFQIHGQSFNIDTLSEVVDVNGPVQGDERTR
jgi:hypothetical protein